MAEPVQNGMMQELGNLINSPLAWSMSARIFVTASFNAASWSFGQMSPKLVR